MTDFLTLRFLPDACAPVSGRKHASPAAPVGRVRLPAPVFLGVTGTGLPTALPVWMDLGVVRANGIGDAQGIVARGGPG